MDHFSRLMFKIIQEIHKVAESKIAPFTRGGKLDYSTPNAVGRIPWTRVGDGTGIPPGSPTLETLYWDGDPLTYGGDGLSFGV